MPENDRFISLEGIEGSGKSTQARLLGEFLTEQGFDVVVTAEPGGTRVGEQIRRILLEPGNRMDPITELLLYNASRAQHIGEVIRPALSAGKVVVTDRYSDSTLAYQGYARGLDMAMIKTLDRIVAGDCSPSLTVLLDLPVEEGMKRNRRAGKVDRFELETVRFHERVREGFLRIAREESGRIRVVSASGSPEEVQQEVRKVVRQHLSERVGKR